MKVCSDRIIRFNKVYQVCLDHKMLLSFLETSKNLRKTTILKSRALQKIFIISTFFH